MVAVAVVGVATSGTSSADCGGPTISVDPASGSPGDPFVVSGRGFMTECNDVNPPPGPHGVGGPPATGIDVTFVDVAGTRTLLGTVDADDDYSLTLATAVPASATTGPAQVEVEGSNGFLVLPAAFSVGGGVIPATPGFTG